MAKKQPATQAAEPGETAPAGLPDEPVELDRPRKRLTPAQFFRAVREYPSGEGVCTYIYRRWPIIDNKLKDEHAKSYIDKVKEPLDEPYLLRHHGGGEYRLCFTDENRPRGQTQVCETVISIWDPELLPVVDVDVLVMEAPKNASYIKMLRARGLLPNEGQDVHKPGGADPAAAELAGLATSIVRGELQRSHNPGESVQNKALDLMAEASKQAIQIAASQGKQTDPIDGLAKLASVLTALRPADDSSLFKVLLESQQKQLELLMSMARKEQGGGGLEGQLGVLEKVAGLIDKFSNRGGSSRGAVWEALLNALPGSLASIGSMLQSLAAMRGAAVPVTPPPAAGGMPVTVDVRPAAPGPEIWLRRSAPRSSARCAAVLPATSSPTRSPRCTAKRFTTASPPSAKPAFSRRCGAYRSSGVSSRPPARWNSSWRISLPTASKSRRRIKRRPNDDRRLHDLPRDYRGARRGRPR